MAAKQQVCTTDHLHVTFLRFGVHHCLLSLSSWVPPGPAILEQIPSIITFLLFVSIDSLVNEA